MNLLEQLLKEHSKANTEKVVHFLGNDSDKLSDFMPLFFSSDKKVAQRASWVVGCLSTLNPSLMKPYSKKLVKNLNGLVPDATKRNTLKVFTQIEIPEILEGKVADITLKFITSKNESISVKAYSLEVLFKIVKKHPEMTQEFIIICEDLYGFNIPAIQAKIKKMSKWMKKNIDLQGYPTSQFEIFKG